MNRDAINYFLTKRSESTTYSALHIAQNCIADWIDADQQYEKWIENAGGDLDEPVKLRREIRKPREQRASLI